MFLSLVQIYLFPTCRRFSKPKLKLFWCFTQSQWTISYKSSKNIIHKPTFNSFSIANFFFHLKDNKVLFPSLLEAPSVLFLAIMKSLQPIYQKLHLGRSHSFLIHPIYKIYEALTRVPFAYFYSPGLSTWNFGWNPVGWKCWAFSRVLRNETMIMH